MASDDKKLVNFRATGETREQIERLMEAWQCDQTAVIVKAIDQANVMLTLPAAVASMTVKVEWAQVVYERTNRMEIMLEELLELARSQHDPPRIVFDRQVFGSGDQASVDNRPKNATCTCKHCGNLFAGTRYATICPDCKAAGHTLTPAECPPCNETRGGI